MTSSNGRDVTAVLLLVLVALLAAPILMMGLGFGGMMGYGWMMGSGPGSGGTWPFVWMLVPLLFILVVLAGGYVVLRRLAAVTGDGDPALEELRMAYARGDLTDEEYEARRRKLEEPD